MNAKITCSEYRAIVRFAAGLVDVDAGMLESGPTDDLVYDLYLDQSAKRPSLCEAVYRMPMLVGEEMRDSVAARALMVLDAI